MAKIVQPEELLERLDRRNNVWDMVTYVNKQLRENRILEDNSVDVVGWSILQPHITDGLMEIYTGEGWAIEIIDDDTRKFKVPSGEGIILEGVWQFSRFNDDILPGKGTWVNTVDETWLRIAAEQTDDLGYVDFSVVQVGDILEFKSPDSSKIYIYRVINFYGEDNSIVYMDVEKISSEGELVQLDYTNLKITRQVR